MIRYGLCCIFAEQPIRFGTTTAAALKRLSREQALRKISGLCLENARSLLKALEYCDGHGIGGFRVNSQILPAKTHPECGYRLEELPEGEAIRLAFEKAGLFARAHGLRMSFHPDQFVVLNSPREDVVRSSVLELEYQAEVAEWIGADVVNIHGGGIYGDKPKALEALRAGINLLSERVRSRLTFENDDKSYTPEDLLPVCEKEGIPLVYDVHHHRCLKDSLSIAEATSAALAVWNREPLFHLSSPLEGWDGPKPQRHHDFINPADFPEEWLGRDLTVEIEAKKKEVAIHQLMTAMREREGAAVR